MPRGGKRPGAGRKPSALTKKTRELAEKAVEGGVTPLEYLLGIMRDEALDRNERVDAAKAAAPYVHPRLNAVDHKSTDRSMSPPERVEFVAVDGEPADKAEIDIED